MTTRPTVIAKRDRSLQVDWFTGRVIGDYNTGPHPQEFLICLRPLDPQRVGPTRTMRRMMAPNCKGGCA